MTLVLGPVRAAWTTRADGDLLPDPAGGDQGRALAAWTARWEGRAGGPRVGAVRRVHTVTQVHGREVVDADADTGTDAATGTDAGTDPVTGPVGHADRVLPVRHGEADVLVTSVPTDVVAVLAADCGTVVLASPEGHAAAVHSGWGGLVAGTLAAAAAALRGRGATRIVGAVGPCIHASCYEFSPADVDRVADVVGPSVRGRTTGGGCALDLPAGLRAALEAADVAPVPGVERCTACARDGSGGGPAYFSHRARRDVGRHALLVWTAGGGRAA